MKARKVEGLDPASPLAENAGRIVRVRLDELRSFAARALEPRRIGDQHDMRIAAKRLRYVLEITELCFGSAGPAARRRARQLQGLLGDLHDCDVMIPAVEARLDDAQGDRGLRALRAHLHARRNLRFEQFTEYWRAGETGRAWTDLERATADVAAGGTLTRS